MVAPASRRRFFDATAYAALSPRLDHEPRRANSTSPSPSPPHDTQSPHLAPPHPHPHSSSPSNESYPRELPAPSPAPLSSAENAAPISAAPKSPPRRPTRSQTPRRPATRVHVPKISNYPRPSIEDPYPENVSRCRPAPPRPATHRTTRAPAHLHPNAPRAPCRTAPRCRRSSTSAPPPADADRTQSRSARSFRRAPLPAYRAGASYRAGTTARRRLLPLQIKLRELHVRWLRNFDISLRPQDHHDLMPEPLHQSRLVRRADSIRLGPRKRVLQQFCLKNLRRLRQHHALPWNRPSNQRHIFRQARAFYFFHRVHRRNSQNRSLMLPRLFNHAHDLLFLHKRPHRVMHQYDFRVLRNFLQGGRHRFLPRIAAFHHAHVL